MLTASGSQPRQPPYEATFLEGFLGLIKVLIQRVPTKIPTKLPRRRRSVRRPYAQSPAALWSSIVSDRATKLARSLSVGKVFLKLVRYEPVDCRCHGAGSSRSSEIGWRWDERFESLLCCVDLEARVSRSSTVGYPQACKRNSSDAAFADRTVRQID
jgi:hypothetical protein